MSHSNDENPDPVLDACLEEILGGVQPPDLTAKILAAWQQKQISLEDPRLAHPPVAEPHCNGVAKSACPAGCEPNRARFAQSPPWGFMAALLAMLLVGFGLGLGALKLTPSARPVDVAKQPAASEIEPLVTDPATPQPARRDAQPQLVATPPDADDDAPETPFALGPGIAAPALDARTVAMEEPQWPEPINDTILVSLVNHSLTELWREHGVQPSERATDEEWCRRVFVRMLGRIPSVEELQAFVSDPSEDKDERLVRRLQEESPYAEEFARHWAIFWTNALIGRERDARTSELVNRAAFEEYLANAWLEDRSMQEVAYELLSANGASRPGSDDFNPAVNFLLAHFSPDGVPATIAVSRLMLGQRAQCYQCHDHPTNESLTQQQFWQLNAFFRQMDVVRHPETQATRLVSRDAPEEEVYFEQMDGYTRAVYPVLPDGTALPKSKALADIDRRRVLAQWVAKSPNFPAAVVNRVWAHFFGYGFTQPVDDIGSHNPPVQADLYEELTEQFAAHGYRLRELTRWIALSDAFRRSSRVSEHNLADAPERGSIPLFSRYYTRQMQPEAVAESLRLVAEARRSGALTGTERTHWLGQVLPNPAAENSAAPSAAQPPLVVMQAPLMQHAVSSERGAVLRRVLDSDMGIPEKVEHLFLAAVARKPNANERRLAEQMIAAADRPQTALEDIWWALLNSSEFILDH